MYFYCNHFVYSWHNFYNIVCDMRIKNWKKKNILQKQMKKLVRFIELSYSFMHIDCSKRNCVNSLAHYFPCYDILVKYHWHALFHSLTKKTKWYYEMALDSYHILHSPIAYFSLSDFLFFSILFYLNSIHLFHFAPSMCLVRNFFSTQQWH